MRPQPAFVSIRVHLWKIYVHSAHKKREATFRWPPLEFTQTRTTLLTRWLPQPLPPKPPPAPLRHSSASVLPPPPGPVPAPESATLPPAPPPAGQCAPTSCSGTAGTPCPPESGDPGSRSPSGLPACLPCPRSMLLSAPSWFPGSSPPTQTTRFAATPS